MVTPPHDPPEPSSHVFVHSLLSPTLSPRSRSHRYLQWILHFTHTDLCWLCLFVACVNHPKPKTRIWFCVRANRKKHLSLAQLTVTLEALTVAAQSVLFSFIRHPLFITKKAPEPLTSRENSTSSYNLPTSQFLNINGSEKT